MKIAWFTPFSQENTISEISLIVTDYLNSLGHQVDLWLTQAKSSLSSSLSQVCYVDDKEVNVNTCERLCTYDIIFYNLGNHCDQHAAIYEVSKIYPGIIILHNFFMHHFFLEYFSKKKKHAHYLQLLKIFYGEAVFQEAMTELEKNKATTAPQYTKLLNYPLFEPALTNARGVIAHEQIASEKIQQVFSGPVIHLPLPSPSTSELIPQTAQEYANHILQFYNDIAATKPTLQLLERVGTELEKMHVCTFMPILSKVAEELNCFVNDLSKTKID